MRILLVEDEVGIVNFLKQGLEEEGFVVEFALDGEKALEMVLKRNYDLLILDWVLPKKSGIEICREYRKTDHQTPVIFLTAKDTVSETVLGLQAGANDYIKKPFSFEELLERIKVQLRTKHSTERQLSIGHLIIDVDAYKVIKNDKEIPLTKKEFELLKMLVSHKGKVCKREDIIKKVWDIHFDYDTSVIEVYINAIRKKLKSAGEGNYIKTVRGVGYIADEL